VAAVKAQGPDGAWMAMLLQQDGEHRTPLHGAAERRARRAPDEGVHFHGHETILTAKATADDRTATSAIGLLQL
jgi:hypothetical protein